MSIEQMTKALHEVGACFAVTTAKVVLPGDPTGRPSYHIHPDESHPHQEKIVRIYTQKQFADWIRTKKAACRSTSPELAGWLWVQYHERWQR